MAKLPFPHILFDLDGTLTDSEPGIVNCVHYALDSMGHPRPDYATLRTFLGPPLLSSFRDTLGMGQQKAEQAVRLYRKRFTETGLYENEVYPGIPTLLAQLSQGGAKLHLATSKLESFAVRILDHFSLTQYFTSITGGGTGDLNHEKATIIQEAIRRGAINPAEAIMVGDRKFDVFGAKQNNMLSVGVLYGYGSEAELAEAGADYIVDMPGLRTLLLGGD